MVGQLLGGVADHARCPANVATAISPEPRILFYKPDVFSDVQGLVTATAPITSGVPLQARITESYRFVSGAELQPEPFTVDLVFYQVRGAASAGVGGLRRVALADVRSLSLERGVIAVELIADGAGAAPRGLITSAGGVVDGPGGVQLTLPAGAVADPTPIDLATLTTSPLPLPDVAGVRGRRRRCGVVGALARGGMLSLPAPGRTQPTRRACVLARIATVGGQTRLVLAGVARLDAGRLVADTRVAGQATALEGVLQPGQYLFVRVADPIGFAGGLVRGVAGAPFAGALVTSDTLPMVSLSTPLGGYLAVGRAGANAFTARDLAKNDTGRARRS